MTRSMGRPEVCGQRPGPPRSVLLGLGVTTVALLAASLWLVARRPSRVWNATGLDVRQVGRLAAAGRFEQALRQVEAALAADPDNGVARVMAAQLSLDRPDPQPQRALGHLDRLRSSEPALAARAEFARGRAVYASLHLDRAEDCWLHALRLDSRVPEAAWALLDLYYLEGRSDEARRLALRQHEIEPDPHDRVHLLLELVRQDAEPPEPGTLAARFAPVVRAHPDDLHAVITLGRALVRNSQAEEGLAILDEATRRRPDSGEAWDALLTSLDAAGQPDRLTQAWSRVPLRWRDDVRLARHEGSAARARGDWAAAARAYRRAWDARPDDVTSAYRLARLLRILGRREEAADCDRFVLAAQAAQAEVADLYKQADAVRDLVVGLQLPLYHRLADNREHLGRRDEARAWHRLVVRDRPDDPYSRDALKRLQSPGACGALVGNRPAHHGPDRHFVRVRP